MMQIQKRKGFTLLELIITVAILVILAGWVAPATVRYLKKAKEAHYMTEAKAVHEAIAMYLMDLSEKGELDTIKIWEDLLMTSVSEKKHVLAPYLGGRPTKRAEIRRLRLGSTLKSYKGIEYAVDGYLIDVDQGGNTSIISRPGG